jgi:hypothetical protein
LGINRFCLQYHCLTSIKGIDCPIQIDPFSATISRNQLLLSSFYPCFSWLRIVNGMASIGKVNYCIGRQRLNQLLKLLDKLALLPGIGFGWNLLACGQSLVWIRSPLRLNPSSLPRKPQRYSLPLLLPLNTSLARPCGLTPGGAAGSTAPGRQRSCLGVPPF